MRLSPISAPEDLAVAGSDDGHLRPRLHRRARSRKLPHSVDDSGDVPDAVAAVPPAAGEATRPQRHHRVARRLHQPGRSARSTRPTQRARRTLVTAEGEAARDHGRPVPGRRRTGVTNQKIDLAAASAVVGGDGMARADRLGRRPRRDRDQGRRHRCAPTAPPDHPMRVVVRGAVRVRAAQGRRLGRADAAVKDLVGVLADQRRPARDPPRRRGHEERRPGIADRAVEHPRAPPPPGTRAP